MSLQRPRVWSIEPVTCCNCAEGVAVLREDDAVSTGAGFMPNLPGAICETCLEVVEALVITDVRDAAATHLLRTANFELPTVDAVQEFLNVHGWQPDVVAAGAMRLHLDGQTSPAYSLLEQAAEAVPERAGWFQVEAAGLRILDGDVGRALDLLESAGEGAHPCWHLHHGLLARSLGRNEAAVEHWRQQTELEPAEPLGWKFLGWALIEDDAEAGLLTAAMERACERFPGTMEFRAWRGLAHYKAGDQEEALADLEASRHLRSIEPDFVVQVDELVSRIRAERDPEA